MFLLLQGEAHHLRIGRIGFEFEVVTERHASFVVIANSQLSISVSSERFRARIGKGHGVFVRRSSSLNITRLSSQARRPMPSAP